MNASSRVLGLGLGAVTLVAAAGMARQQRPAAVPDFARIAEIMVNKCGNINPDDLVWIKGSARDQKLLEEIAIEVRQLGAHPIITLASDTLTRRLITDVPEKFDAQAPAFEARLAEIVNAVISVEYGEKPGLLADIKPQRLTRIDEAHKIIHETLLNRNVISVHLGNNLYPTEARAKQFGISRDQLSEIFWKAVNTDYDQLQQIGERVRTILASGKELRITAPNGTDLALKIASRPVFVSDGVVSDEDRYGPAAQAWLPAGEVYLTPVAGSANGTFVADTFFYEGALIEGLKLTFKDGKLLSMTAKSDISQIQKRFDAAPPGKDLFAAIDIGINPGIQIPAGSRMVTWIASGTISVGFGGNKWAGGDNDVAYDLFAHLPNGTLMIDGQRKLIDAGKLIDR